MTATTQPEVDLPPSPGTVEPVPDAQRVDRAALADMLDGRWRDARRATRALCAEPDLLKIEGLSRAEHRTRVLSQLQTLADRGFPLRGFPEYVGGSFEPGANLAGFDELVLLDSSLQIKAGVQFGLFASAILNLGTRPHHERWLPDALSLRLPGIYAMTEMGHGSNVGGLLTTATYDPASEEFVIHTPVRAAWKDFLGNAALHGRAAIVFAQLITRNVNRGVHAFFVPVRDDDGALLPGIQVEDDGQKGGLNGVDNGRLAFDQVRIPRTNLLNRYGDVAPNGAYSSAIESPGRRFFTMLSTLVQGRVSLSGAAVVAAKVAMAISLTYSTERRQFAGADEHQEVVLLDYQRHQRRLLPLLARTYAAQFAQHELLDMYHQVFTGARDTDADRADLETHAAAMKTVNTWLALDALQESREACGGAGFMAENRLTGLRADLDVYVTFEGDNNVLLQLVGKRLLQDYGRELAHADIAGKAKWVAEQAADATLHRTGLRRTAQSIRDTGFMARSAGHLRSPQTQRELLADRVESMVEEVALALRKVRRAPAEEQVAVFNAYQDVLIRAARSHAELLQWEAFNGVVDGMEEGPTRQVLTWLRDLYGLTLIERDLAWYLTKGRMSGQRAEAVTSYVNRLMARLRPHARDLVAAFGYGPDQLRAPIASGREAAMQFEAREYQRRQRALGEEPINEKVLHEAAKRLGQGR